MLTSKVTTNLDIPTLYICIQRLFCFMSIKKSTIEKKKHSLGPKELMLSYYCIELSKNQNRQKCNNSVKDFLCAMSCPWKVSREKSEEGDRERQKQIGNGWYSIFNLFASPIFFTHLVLACFVKIVTYFGSTAKRIFRRLV